MLCGKCPRNSDNKLDNLCRRLTDSYFNNGYVKLCTFFTISISAILIPLISGLVATDCKDKGSFLPIGSLLVLILVLPQIKDKRNSKDSQDHRGQNKPTQVQPIIFSKEHSQSEGQHISASKRHSLADSGISSIPITRSRQMRLKEEGQQISSSKRNSKEDNKVSSISNTRSRQMPLEKDRRFSSFSNTRSSQMRLEEDEDMMEFRADSEFSSISNTRSRQMRLDEERQQFRLPTWCSCAERQHVRLHPRYSYADSGVSSISNTRYRQMQLDGDEDCLEFSAEGQQFRLHPRYSYADSGVSSISNTRSRQMQLDGETSFILENPYKSIPEVVEQRNVGDSTSYYAQEVSRSSPPETTSLLDCESSRAILEKHNSCNILRIQGSDV